MKNKELCGNGRTNSPKPDSVQINWIISLSNTFVVVYSVRIYCIMYSFSV